MRSTCLVGVTLSIWPSTDHLDLGKCPGFRTVTCSMPLGLPSAAQGTDMHSQAQHCGSWIYPVCDPLQHEARTRTRKHSTAAHGPIWCAAMSVARTRLWATGGWSAALSRSRSATCGTTRTPRSMALLATCKQTHAAAAAAAPTMRVMVLVGPVLQKAAAEGTARQAAAQAGCPQLQAAALTAGFRQLSKWCGGTCRRIAARPSSRTFALIFQPCPV